MTQDSVPIRPIALKYSLVAAVVCIMYFLIMRYTGLINNVYLRFINYAFLAIGIYMALTELRRRTDDHIVKYLRGIVLSFVVIVFTSLFFAIFIFLYTQFIDPGFLALISEDLPHYNGHMNAFMIGIYIFSESFLFGLIIGLVVMQLFRRNASTYEEPEDKALIGKN
jgi:hypothetical protein